jgi:hypothetical protein
MIFWKNTGAFFNSKGITTHSYKPFELFEGAAEAKAL